VPAIGLPAFDAVVPALDAVVAAAPALPALGAPAPVPATTTFGTVMESELLQLMAASKVQASAHQAPEGEGLKGLSMQFRG
jgi:hypothetical protein